jgi:prepilin-type N-terminal cleavage/methylation domain-containing protein
MMLSTSVPKSRQVGFTLVEIAIVLVIIALLLGTFLRASELITSARVRRLAESTQSVQAAYYGFVDRYHRVAGDWSAAAASAAIGEPITGGGNENGRLDNPAGASAYDEANALWEHLAKAQFIKGSYVGTPGAEPSASNTLAPSNVYNQVIIVGRTNEYLGTNPVKLHVVIGRGVPVRVMRELDVKIDDGAPATGTLRATLPDAGVTVFAGTNNWGGQLPECVTATVTPGPKPSKPPIIGPSIWNVGSGAPDCNGAAFF